MTDTQPHPFLARRVLGAKPSATKEMTRLANQLRREGRSVIALSQGEPDFPTPAHVREAAKQAHRAWVPRVTEPVTSAGGAAGLVSRSGIAGQVSGASIAAPIMAVIRPSASWVTEKP